MQMLLAQSSFGRIVLHLACACRDHKFQWHWQGIRREVVQISFISRPRTSFLSSPPTRDLIT